MGGVCREVLTLQLGHYTNFVGTHWWNIQDAALCYDLDHSDPHSEINNNVLFREGQTLRGQPTYTPRLILLDLKGSLSSLKQEGDLYGVSQVEPALTWKGSLTVHREDPVAKNQFLQQLNRLGGEAHSGNVTSTASQREERSVAERPLDLSQGAQRLENSVRVWSDYLGVHLHPKTISLIQQYNHSSTSNRFEAFGFGEKLMRDPAFLDDFEDRLHFYIEECDYLQGFHVLCDLQDGFAGLSSKVVELLNDEYGGKAIFTCGFAPTTYSDTGPGATVYRLLNSIMGIVHLSSHSSVFCPMSLDRGFLELKQGSPVSFPHVIYDASLSYHSSALLATALETLSIPYRLQSNATSLTQLTDSLSVSGRKVVTASAAVPFAVRDTEALPDVLAEQRGALPWTLLSSCGEVKDARCFAQSVVSRGIGREQQVSNLPPGVKGPSVLHSCPTGEDVLNTFLHSHFPAAMSAVHLVQTPCKVTTPYPQFFSGSFNKRGQLTGGRVPSVSAMESIPVLTALQSTAATYSVLHTLHRQVSRLNLQRFGTFFAAGTELDDFREVLEELRTLAQCYRTNFELDDDSDEE
ncbi:protein misato homolog 1 [Pristis pectinata]|uniref:protein misato homolog 1 n=1 Tax=Pristis pectinata TaxID=685728 RepID=UPI00223E0711|nr:protein misato homolog 1 [Pristis pectinata]